MQRDRSGLHPVSGGGDGNITRSSLVEEEETFVLADNLEKI